MNTSPLHVPFALFALVWLWQGRDLELVPRQAGPPIQTMSAGYAEIDGVPVDVLPAADGTPSKIRRTVKFDDLSSRALAK